MLTLNHASFSNYNFRLFYTQFVYPLHNYVFPFRACGRSMYMFNNRDPRIQPWWTPRDYYDYYLFIAQIVITYTYKVVPVCLLDFPHRLSVFAFENFQKASHHMEFFQRSVEAAVLKF